MSRKRCRRRVWAQIPRREFLPKLPADQVTELGLGHSTNFDLIAKGEADAQVMWDLVACVLMWSKAAEELQAGVDEMVEQVQLTDALVRRYGLTGRVAFEDGEFELARRGVEVMDQLAELVDKPTAIACSEWGLMKMQAAAAAAAVAGGAT
jgi:acetaldehyde dehydrogenase (acetylating)